VIFGNDAGFGSLSGFFATLRIDSKDGMMIDRSELIAEPKYLFVYSFSICANEFFSGAKPLPRYFFCF
jgi:hypothetical protein